MGESIALLFRAAPGYEVRMTPHAAMVLTGEPAADLNCGIIDRGPEPEASLRAFVGRVRQRDLPVMMLLADEVAGALGPVAAELGLHHAGQMPLMVCRPSVPGGGPGRFSVERITSDKERREAVALAAAAFSLPPDSFERAFGQGLLDAPGFDCFLAREGDGTPVSSVQTTRNGPAVGIWVMATAPQQQRKGAGRALLEHVIAYHLDRGAGYFYLGATQVGLPLYERTGFRTIAEAAVWLLGSSTQVISTGHEG
jgi:GNAT superfamily N-acetyltransferase